MAEVTHVKNKTEGPIRIDLSIYDEESGAMKKKQIVTLAPKKVKVEGSPAPGVTPVPTELWEQAKLDERVQRRLDGFNPELEVVG